MGSAGVYSFPVTYLSGYAETQAFYTRLAQDGGLPAQSFLGVVVDLDHVRDQLLPQTRTDLGLEALVRVAVEEADAPRPYYDQDIVVVQLDPATGEPVVASRIAGRGDESLSAMEVDARGRIYLLGTSTSRDFAADPRTTDLRRAAPGSDRDVFMARIDGRSGQVESVVVLGGALSDLAGTLAVGADGSVFVQGRGDSPTFPGADPNVPWCAGPDPGIAYLKTWVARIGI